MKSSNKVPSLKKLLAQAAAGDSSAACLVGDAYREGSGVEQSWEQAFRWYGLSAMGGDAWAQNNLGTLYLEGLGCEEDLRKAAYWYARSTHQGVATAQYNLAMRYIQGQGVKQSYAKAMRLLKKAAAQGYYLANYELGVMFQHGEGCIADCNKAILYYRLAVDGGDDRADSALRELERSEEIRKSGSGLMDDWQRAYESLRDARLSDSESKSIRILDLVCEGGGITLWGKHETPDAWRFWCDLGDWTPTLIDEPAVARTSIVVESWSKVPDLLDDMSRNWHRLYPVEVHPDFRDRVWAAVERCRILERLIGKENAHE